MGGIQPKMRMKLIEERRTCERGRGDCQRMRNSVESREYEEEKKNEGAKAGGRG